jgi:mono/diheme cytochrome c family protein
VKWRFTVAASKSWSREETMPRLVLSVAILVASASATLAEDPGDLQAGFNMAQHVCAKCHGISAEPSPLPQAPRFREVADQKGMTGTALTVWMQTSHPTMPNIVLTKQQTLDVVAYILSLKGRE